MDGKWRRNKRERTDGNKINQKIKSYGNSHVSNTTLINEKRLDKNAPGGVRTHFSQLPIERAYHYTNQDVSH